jgi:hypothetical protein
MLVLGKSVLSPVLQMMLATRLDLLVVGEANDHTAVAEAGRPAPHLAVVDADACRANGLEVTAALHRVISKPNPKMMLEAIHSLGRLPC